MSATYEGMSPGGHETYATSIFSKIKTYLDSNPYGYVSKTGDTMTGNLTAPKFIGALQGNADTATTANTASKLGSSNVGSATQPIYLNGGTATACTYTLGKSVPSDAVFTDTKNTAGSTDTSSKLFLIGATSQAANPQTYSQDTAYVGTDGCLYSGGTKVLTAHQDISGKVSTEGDTISGDYVNTADFSEGGVYGKRVTTYGPWGIDVEEYLADSLWSRLSLRDSDILLTKTWDGTNTSLKTAVKESTFRSYSTYTNTDFDSLPIGTVYNSGTCSHSPLSGSVYMLVTTLDLNSSSHPKAQYAIDFNGNNTNSNVYFRNQTAGTWRGWIKLTNNSYSAVEEPIGQWTDGKIIYRRTFTGNCADSANVLVNTFSDYVNIVQVYGWATSKYSNSWGIPSGRTDGYNVNWFYNVSNKQFYLAFGNAYDSSGKYYISIEYIK